MDRIGLILFAGLFFLPLFSQLDAQQDDPSELFLKAYLAAQQGEKLEHDDHFKTALAKYRFAGSLIGELRKWHGDWQPAIVEYRGRKISEGILRIENKISTQNNLAASVSRVPEAVPSLPDTEGWSEPGPEVVMPQVTETGASGATVKEATKKLRGRVDQLQAALDKSRTDLETARKEKELVNTRLKETASKLEQAQSEIEKSRKAEHQVRDQLTQEIARLKDAVTTAEESRVTAEKQKDETNTKFAEANKQIATLVRERDEALTRLKGTKEADQRVEALVAENTDLKHKLANAERSVRELGENKPRNKAEFAEVKRRVAQLQEQLAESEKRNQYFVARVAELDVQLDQAGAQLQKASLNGPNAEETARIAQENELLRNILMRERQEEARRYQAKKLMLAELDKLKIKSESLDKQIEFLAQPITKLSNEELALLRQPVVSISDPNSGILRASFIFARKSPADSIKIAEPEEKKKSAGDEDRTATDNSGAGNAPGDFKADVPNNLQDVARAAKESFEQGKYPIAEKQYQEILIKSPNNFYALSNLGVVYLQSGNFRAAELTLKKALTISPKDEFVHTTLGMVYYRQSKFDDAIPELTKAIEINPKSATAHNYLGITAIQKGRQEEAEKEILEAIADNPDYADAHFNLAVLFATAQPPAKELAKRHYAKATALGNQPDPSLEKLLQ